MLPNVISLLPSYAMLGNPIVLTAVSNNSEDKELTVALCRYGNSEDVLFSESYVVRKNRVPLYVDISDVLKAFVALPALPALPGSVAGAHGALSRFLLLTNTTAGSSKEIAILYGQFPAGELIRRELSSSALMREKLVGVYANEARDTPAPFFSLRSRAYAVNLYEGELMPLYFMSETAFELKVFDSGGAEVHRYSYSIGDGQPTVFYLHLAPLVTALRKYFKVVFNGSAAQTIHVALSPNPQSRSLRTATFLNSLGFYEKLLLTGAASRARSAKVLELEQRLGGQQALVALKRKYYNNTLAEVVLNQNDFEKIRISGDARLVQLKDPIFREPSSRWGRAHLYAPYKMLGSAKIKTLWFNIGVMWMGTALLYIMLYFDWLRIIVTQADKMATRRIAKRIARIIPR